MRFTAMFNEDFIQDTKCRQVRCRTVKEYENFKEIMC